MATSLTTHKLTEKIAPGSCNPRFPGMEEEKKNRPCCLTYIDIKDFTQKYPLHPLVPSRALVAPKTGRHKITMQHGKRTKFLNVLWERERHLGLPRHTKSMKNF